MRELIGMHLEIIGVVPELIDPDRLHALLHAPDQARLLVGAEIETARSHEILEQFVESRSGGGIAHGRALLRNSSVAGPIASSGKTPSNPPAPMGGLRLPEKRPP